MPGDGTGTSARCRTHVDGPVRNRGSTSTTKVRKGVIYAGLRRITPLSFVLRLKFGKKSKVLSLSVGSDHVAKASNASDIQCSTGSHQSASSSDLLAQMHARNASLADVLNPREDESDEDDGFTGNRSAPLPRGPPSKTDQLLDELRTFVLFETAVQGVATTDEILTRFKTKLKPDESLLFREMLRQICDFERDSTGCGKWRLKAEYK